jgi:hypothetical protein
MRIAEVEAFILLILNALLLTVRCQCRETITYNSGIKLAAIGLILVGTST